MKQPPADDRPPVAVAVVVDQGQALLVRRRVAEGRLSWQFPAGKVETGESPAEAAVRETLEEAGVGVQVVGALGQRVHPDTDRLLIYFACGVVNGQAHVTDEDEIAEVAWCDLTSISAYIPYPLYDPVQQYLNDSRASTDDEALA